MTQDTGHVYVLMQYEWEQDDVYAVFTDEAAANAALAKVNAAAEQIRQRGGSPATYGVEEVSLNPAKDELVAEIFGAGVR